MSRVFMCAVVACLALGAARASADTAAADFQALCASCHGEDARGGGLAGKGLSVAPPDLTRISARHGGEFPEAMIFETITGLDMPASHGNRDMPIWGDVLVSEAIGESVTIEDAKAATAAVEKRIEALVKYLKSIQLAP